MENPEPVFVKQIAKYNGTTILKTNSDGLNIGYDLNYRYVEMLLSMIRGLPIDEDHIAYTQYMDDDIAIVREDDIYTVFSHAPWFMYGVRLAFTSDQDCIFVCDGGTVGNKHLCVDNEMNEYHILVDTGTLLYIEATGEQADVVQLKYPNVMKYKIPKGDVDVINLLLEIQERGTTIALDKILTRFENADAVTLETYLLGLNTKTT